MPERRFKLLALSLCSPCLLTATAAVASEAAWRPCVHVCNDHGQALTEWLDAATEKWHEVKKLAVLHVDAHNDLNVPDDSAVFDPVHETAWMRDAAQRRKISSSADLANFQLIAVWAGLIDRVIWIKQGAGPTEHFRATLGLDEGGSFQEGIPWNLNELPLVSDIEESLETKPFYYHEVYEADLPDNVVTDNLLGHLHAQPFILDIDLDFFVWGESKPGLPPWRRTKADQTDFPISECRDVLSACGWTDPACPSWGLLGAIVSDRGAAESMQPWQANLGVVDVQAMHKCKEAFKLWHAARLQDLYPEAHELSHELYAAEWVLVVDQLRRSRPRHDAALFASQLSRLEAFLVRLAARAAPPVLVTVARSADAFTRILDVPELEDAVLALVERVWGHCAAASEPLASGNATAPGESSCSRLATSCVGYAAGTAPLAALRPLAQRYRPDPSTKLRTQ